MQTEQISKLYDSVIRGTYQKMNRSAQLARNQFPSYLPEKEYVSSFIAFDKKSLHFYSPRFPVE